MFTKKGEIPWNGSMRYHTARISGAQGDSYYEYVEGIKMGKAYIAMPRVKINARRKRKPVLCPKCGHRFIDRALSTVIKIIALLEYSQTEPDLYAKCYNCGTELGIRKLG